MLKFSIVFLNISVFQLLYFYMLFTYNFFLITT